MEDGKDFNIPIARPYFMGDETRAIEDLLQRGWVSQGPMVAQFEKAVASYARVGFAVATSSCTAALHLTMLGNGIGQGDDVLCPSYTFIATANAIRHSGAEAQFVEIDAQTLNLDVKLTEECILSLYDSNLCNKETGNNLKAILLVHQVGIACDIDAFEQLCRKFEITLLEDSACALGSSYKGNPLGGSGNPSCLSFHPRKVITTGEGGMMLTNDEDLAEQARILRAHGASSSDYFRHHACSTEFELYNSVGYNYRMTDIQAVIGLKQMELLEWFIERRLAIASRYDQAFSNAESTAVINPPDYQTRWNRQSYPLMLNNGNRQMRDNLMIFLHDRGIATRRGIPPIHMQPAYARGQSLPITEAVSDTSLFLPIFPQMTELEVEYVINCVHAGLNAGQSLPRCRETTVAADDARI